MRENPKFTNIFKRAAHEFSISRLPHGHLSVLGKPTLRVMDINGNHTENSGLDEKYGYALNPKVQPDYGRLGRFQKLILKMMGGGYQFLGKSMFKHFKRNPWNVAALAIIPLSVPVTLLGFGGYTAFAKSKNAREYRQDFYEGWNADFSNPDKLPMTSAFIDFRKDDGTPVIMPSNYLRSIRYDFMDQIRRDVFKIKLPFKLKSHFEKTLPVAVSFSIYEENNDKILHVPVVV